MFPLYETDGKSTCPLGMAMCQNRLAIPTWSYAMEISPPARIVELGTGNGGLTTALALHAKMINCKVISYDRMAPTQHIEPVAKMLGAEFRCRPDLWACEAEIGKEIAEPGRTFVLCDGGDKKRELATFARYLKPGDVIAAHDYDAMHEIDPSSDALTRWWPWSEIRKADGDLVASNNNLTSWLQSYFDRAGWIVYRKR